MNQQTFTIMGDPQNLGAHLDNFLKANPMVSIKAMTSCPYMISPDNSLIQTPQNKPVPVHVLYVVFEGELSETPQNLKN